MAATMVPSSPSRTQVTPRAMTSSQWNGVQGNRSSRAGMSVSIGWSPAVPVGLACCIVTGHLPLPVQGLAQGLKERSGSRQVADHALPPPGGLPGSRLDPLEHLPDGFGFAENLPHDGPPDDLA